MDSVSIYLDANENPFLPYPATEHEVGLNRYPEPQPRDLVLLFSQLFDTPPDRLFLSRGADEAIDLLVRAFCEPNSDGVVIAPPSFPMYETAAHIQGARVHEVPLRENDGYQLDVEAILAVCSTNPLTKIIFTCSPNNPTGNLMDRAGLIRLADSLLGKSLVVVDELYLEYSGTQSLSVEIDDHPNLVVLRSVSKEFSLAGERLGITLAHPEVIQILGKIMAPYSIPVSVRKSVASAMTAKGLEYAYANIQTIVAERKRVADVLNNLPVVHKVYPSDANFLLVQVSDASQLVKLMNDSGISIRDRSSVIDQAVRISIGTQAENNQMLDVFIAFGNDRSK